MQSIIFWAAFKIHHKWYWKDPPKKYHPKKVHLPQDNKKMTMDMIAYFLHTSLWPSMAFDTHNGDSIYSHGRTGSHQPKHICQISEFKHILSRMASDPDPTFNEPKPWRDPHVSWFNILLILKQQSQLGFQIDLYWDVTDIGFNAEHSSKQSSTFSNPRLGMPTKVIELLPNLTCYCYYHAQYSIYIFKYYDSKIH